MGKDKNTTIGFILLAILLFAYFWINSKNRLTYEAQEKKKADSIALATKKLNKDTVPSVSSNPTLQQDTLVAAVEKLDTLENELIRIVFSNKGARPVYAELKNYKRYDQKPVVLIQQGNSSFNYRYRNADKSYHVAETFFTAGPIQKNKEGGLQIVYKAQTAAGATIEHQFTLPLKDYRFQLQMAFDKAPQLFDQNNLNLEWSMAVPPIEKDIQYEATQTHFCYLESNGDHDFEYMSKADNISFKNSVNWLGVKRQFFVNALESPIPFSSVGAEWSAFDKLDSQHLVKYSSHGLLALQGSGDQKTASVNWYMGPSDYNVLKKYGNQMETIVPYGSGIFSFVKYINRYFLLPIFDYIQGHVASMGFVILLLTLIIRLITSPILYKSYLSGAKMKALKPEIDALREKYKDDQQVFGMEQMKLFKSAGVSPLGGCIPALLQIPIFMSLYYFFQANIDLRGKAFLWSQDLASYDSIVQFSFHIPFYGNHVSLFTLTAVITSLLISLYGMSNMQDNSNPLMKYMPYIFPVLLLGVFNNLPSALTWYYTISNTITLAMQIVIQKYIINPEKILEEIEENRRKPVKKSKLQERIEAMQESQKRLKDMGKK